MNEGWILKGSRNYIVIQKGIMTINFDIIVRTYWRKIFCVNIQHVGEMNFVAMEISKNKAYYILGHAGEEATMATSKALG